MSEVEASRETDARVARAMGLTVVATSWPCGRDPVCGHYKASVFVPPMGSWFSDRGPVVADGEDGWPPREWPHGEPVRMWGLVRPVEHYTTDPAVVVPMMERIAALTGDTLVQLWREPDGSWRLFIDDLVSADAYKQDLFDGATANLVVCAALLAVAEEGSHGEQD